MRGKHVYYNQSTQGQGGRLTLKGKWRGGLSLSRDPELSKAEVSQRLTPGT